MSGYLQEISERDGNVQVWQTPNRQRWWGLVAAILPAALLIHATWGGSRLVVWEVVAAAVLLVGALMVATYTVRFSLNLKAGTYEDVRGFLPVFFWGDRGKAVAAFQCVAVRKETMLDAAKHENDPGAEDFDQYRAVLVWKNPRRAAMLLDTEPLTWEESRSGEDFYARVLGRAREIADPLGLEVLDQTVAYAAVGADVLEPGEGEVPVQG